MFGHVHTIAYIKLPTVEAYEILAMISLSSSIWGYWSLDKQK